MSIRRLGVAAAIVLTSACVPAYAPPQAGTSTATLSFRHDLSSAHILRKVPSLSCESSENIQGKPFSQNVTVPIAANQRAYFLVIREQNRYLGAGAFSQSGCRDMFSFEPRAGESYTILSVAGVCTAQIETRNGTPPPDLQRHEVPNRCMDNI